MVSEGEEEQVDECLFPLLKKLARTHCHTTLSDRRWRGSWALSGWVTFRFWLCLLGGLVAYCFKFLLVFNYWLLICFICLCFVAFDMWLLSLLLFIWGFWIKHYCNALWASPPVLFYHIVVVVFFNVCVFGCSVILFLAPLFNLWASPLFCHFLLLYQYCGNTIYLLFTGLLCEINMWIY